MPEELTDDAETTESSSALQILVAAAGDSTTDS